MADTISYLSYTSQPYFIAGTCSISESLAVASIENPDGIFDPDLSNYTTVIPDASVTEFGINYTFGRNSAHLAAVPVTAALIGCAMLTYEDNGAGGPDMETVFSEDMVGTYTGDIGTVAGPVVSFAHNSQDNIKTFCGRPLPGVISGGRTNLIFSSIGVSGVDAVVNGTLSFTRTAANVTARPHARVVLGHLFVGVDIGLVLNPRAFTWKIESKNQRFLARDFGAINSDGTLVRSSSFEVIKILHDTVFGLDVTGSVGSLVLNQAPNFFDLVKVSNSYPVLFNPYPSAAPAPGALTAEQANYLARQNFFSIYGFVEDVLSLQIGEFREGLNTEYKAQFRIQETR